MAPDFARSLEGVLRRFDRRIAAPAKPGPTPGSTPVSAKDARESEAAYRRGWFARFANNRVMPRLQATVEAVEHKGASAQCRLFQNGQMLTAELVIVPPHLPEGAPPPRLSISAAPGDRAVAIDYTGTFPFVGPDGGFGAEIDYDTVYPSQVDDKILDFVTLATGA